MIYSKAVVDVICDLIIEGYDLRAIGGIKGLPAKATVLRWLNDSRKIYFLDSYRKAKELQHIVVSEEVVSMAIEYGYKNLGQLGGKVFKLQLKRHGNLQAGYEAACRELAIRKGEYPY